MPALPPDPAAAGSAVNPARTRLQSPLAAAMRGRVYHLRRQPPPPQRRLQVLAITGTLLVHVFFLFGFVLGAAFEPAQPPPPRSEQMLQVRLIEPPEPPPPAVRGTPAKERGPRHQGRRRAPAHHERTANSVPRTSSAPAAPGSPGVAVAAQTPALLPDPVHATPPAAALPAPAPLPLPEPFAPARELPALAAPLPTLLPPAPAQFQPEPVRAPQHEGNRPVLPPASLALPKAAVSAPANLPTMAIHMDVPPKVAAVGVTPAPEPAGAPDLPRLQPLPLPAQSAPTVTLQTSLLTPTLVAPKAVNEPQAGAAAPGQQAAPATVASALIPPQPMPVPMLELDPASRAAAALPVLLPASSSSIAVAQVTPPTPVANPTGVPDPAVASSAASAPESAVEIPTPAVATDVSRAPDATARGSDTAAVGEPVGAASVPSTPQPAAITATSQLETGATPSGARGKSLAAGQPGGNQPGATQGARQGAVGEYVQLKPAGDTEIMRRGGPDIGYQRTRFDKDWTPEDESSIDTALRRAVDKTTLKRTVHLPRGVRIECAVKPLLPIALFSCRNPDPPAAPVADNVYDPMHLAPAEPLAPPVEASSAPVTPASASAPMIRFDHRAECAAARLSGGPAPPGCAELQTVRPITAPTSSGSTWVPASDQFH